ncbi:tyrosine-type recombinase/integrase [Nocardia amamiensis]|uniref:Tyrosine-type recombinase/integrase n=1 Tax=Nocardia amamiensis TaxID=404578 RepID=A0ABS0D200_9NOCA|nr:tyrosine-type recombinase/integrase [Nocardia amamiensis]MBF6302666.1 tyrosine-type recombinase/integrase [Nocardia amamiensis]
MRDEGAERDLSALVVPDVGRLEETGDMWVPYRLLDADGVAIQPVAAFFVELQAADKRPSTIRSYGHDLLRWWRFLAAIGVVWDKVTPVEGRDFARWMLLADKPVRAHWRSGPGGRSVGRRRRTNPTVNAITGRPSPGMKYSAASRAHAETVLRAFYDFQLERGAGPLINPFPLDRGRRSRRANAHHNPMDPYRKERVGRYRPKVPKRIPKKIPDEQFNAVFAGLKSNRDRALLAFWVSTGARAEELLSAHQGDEDLGQQLIAVTRKGSREVQQLPVSPDAFVWLRLYQEEIWRRGAPRGRRYPLWFTLRRPWRQLSYPAARAMFSRAQQVLGSNWPIHALRHTAAYRMASDPEMDITDVQWILGHAYLTTTQLYTCPSQDEVIASVLAHHDRQSRRTGAAARRPAQGYNPRSLDMLFGRPE